MQSPQTFSRGNFSRSISATRKPAAAQKAAQTDPAGPAPTMATSTTSMALSVNCDRAAFNTGGARFKKERVSLMGWSIPILRVSGIQLRIHITFLLLIGYVALNSWSSAIFVLLLFLCVVLHEFGHAIAAKGYGINTPDITLLPIGGVARLERIPEEPKQELVIAIAGPLVNVIIAACLYLVTGSRGHVMSGVQSEDMLIGIRQINILLVLFNLLPAFPMDGGRVLRALLATRLTYARATQVAATVGQIFAFLFGIVGHLRRAGI